MLSRSLLTLAILLSTAACVTTSLTPAGQKVRVTGDPGVIRGCEYVGDVQASDRMNGGAFGQDAAEENTYRRIKNKAAALGGNVVLLNRGNTNFQGSSARGEVYRCPVPAPVSP